MKKTLLLTAICVFILASACLSAFAWTADSSYYSIYFDNGLYTATGLNYGRDILIEHDNITFLDKDDGITLITRPVAQRRNPTTGAVYNDENIASLLQSNYYAYGFDVSLQNANTEAYKPRLYFTCLNGNFYETDSKIYGRIGISLSVDNGVLCVQPVVNATPVYDQAVYYDFPDIMYDEYDSVGFRVIAVVDKVMSHIKFCFYDDSISFPTSTEAGFTLFTYTVDFYDTTSGSFSDVTIGCWDWCYYDTRTIDFSNLDLYRVFPEQVNIDDHYQLGYDKGYDVGFDDGEQYGYNYGYSLGQGAQIDVGGAFDSITQGTVNMFQAMFDFEIFGINVAGTITAVLVIVIVAFIIRRLKQ